MKIPVNVAFSILIKIDGRLKEFNFRRRNEKLYDANTNDEYSARYYFHLKKEGDTAGWKIEGQHLPPWLYNNEAIISDILESKIKQ